MTNKVNKSFLKESHHITDLKLCSVRLINNSKFPWIILIPNRKKITVNGCPRIFDYINKKKYYKKIKDILFLSFHNKSGIPPYKHNKSLNWISKV